ncbi:MAG: hypothetical protein ACLFTN_03445 [Phycisphaerae bacterium]
MRTTPIITPPARTDRCSGRLAYLLLAALLMGPVACRDEPPAPPPLDDANRPAANADDARPWLEDVTAPLPLTPPSRRALTNYAAARTGLLGLTPDLPGALRQDRQPRVVLISLSDGVKTARVLIGTGRGVVPAIEHAAAQAREMLPDTVRPRWLRLDVVQEVHRIDKITDETLTHPLDRDGSLWGLGTTREHGMVLLPIEIMRDKLMTGGNALNPFTLQEFLRQRPWRARGDGFSAERNDHSKVRFQFRTDATFTDGQEVVELYRGHRLIGPLTPSGLLARAVQAGRYLTRMVKPSGQFVYHYYPATNGEKRSYNLPRHAGTIYAMMQLYEVTGDKELLAAAQRALKFLLAHVRPAKDTVRKRAVVVEDNVVKLGGVGLAGIAIARYVSASHDRQPLETLHQLGRWIRSVQNPDTGELHTHYMTWPNGRRVDRKMAYYPGEAILALMRLHELDPKGDWLESARKAALWQVKSQQGKDYWADHWLLYALNEIHAATGNDPLARHAHAMTTEAIVEQQRRRPEPGRRDWVGSFYIPPRITPTATRMEGLAATWFLADRQGRDDLTEPYRETLLRGVRFVLQGQVMPEQAMFHARPQVSLGGFTASLTDPEIRIDFVQHSISALLMTREILLKN